MASNGINWRLDTGSGKVAQGLHITWSVLAKTRNRAVLPLLARSLRSNNDARRAAAIRCAVRRQDADSHRLLLQQWIAMTDADKALLYEAHRSLPHHMAAILRESVLRGEAGACEAACQIIAGSRDYELLPPLVQAAEDRQHHRLAAVVAALRRLVFALHQELDEWKDNSDPRRRDPAFARRNALAALEHALKSYPRHQRRELIEAYVLLAPDAALRGLLGDVQDPCHAALVQLLSTDSSNQVITKLVALLRDSDAPTAALEAIARRTDREFVQAMFAELKHPVPLRVLHNMKRLDAVAWLEDQRELLLEVGGRAQAVAVDLAAASSISRESRFALYSFLLKAGLGDGRRASCLALAEFDSAEADLLIRSALDDPDAGVQAAAVGQLRLRGFSDALTRLVSLLDSPSAEVRDAARSSLAEFNFVRYRAMFDLLDEAAIHTTGALVYKVDPSSREWLAQELAAPSVSARLRGIEMVVAMGAAQDVRQQLIELARSENVSVRQEAVTALGLCQGGEVLEALHIAASDEHPSVREAAAWSIDRTRALNSRSMKRIAVPSGV